MRDFRRFGRAKRMRIPGFRLARNQERDQSGDGDGKRKRERERGRKSRIEW